MLQDALNGSRDTDNLGRDSGPQCDDPVGRVEAKTEKTAKACTTKVAHSLHETPNVNKLNRLARDDSRFCV